jgi:hypothetical protein
MKCMLFNKHLICLSKNIRFTYLIIYLRLRNITINLADYYGDSHIHEVQKELTADEDR